MTINAAKVAAGKALEILRFGWNAQAQGQLKTSWMLHGRPGVGKTMIVQQLADEIGAQLFDLRLTTIEPQDLRGLPYYDHTQKKTVWYRPEDLPDDPAQPAILFLDELTAASPYLQPTVYGLLQERRVGRHALPDNVMIIAAGNTVEDGAVAYEMGTALSDRLIHMEVIPDADDWVGSYALQKALHPSVIAFIKSRPDLFDTSEATLRRGQTIAATPRSWERVSQIMYAAHARDHRQILIAGTVGEAAAAEFGLVADEIVASVRLDDMMAAERPLRQDMYPGTLNGLTALIYALHAKANPETLPVIIEILVDLQRIPSHGLPLAELVHFGFELVISKAVDNGWQGVFGSSDAFRQYAEQRRQNGLE